ncbi:glycosyltransferase family 2 protein, partial [Candidatus Woesearchaeota archaeon]|nr:glycosyltransferase family 2 protein [Candidatus Woesearchaeota archaeon]
MISLCMIVKNEEDYIGNALDAVKDLVKEIIVVDTGSTDKTAEVGKKHGAKVFNFKWIDDFSAARNFSIEQAKEPWILVLDADEILAREDIEVIKKLVKDDSITGYTLIQRNYTNDKDLPNITINKKDYKECKNYYGYCENPLVRLFKNDSRIRFVNKVHEI